MNVLKIGFAAFLLAIMGMALIIPAEAKNNPNRSYAQPYVYHYKQPKAKKEKAQSAPKTLRIPSLSSIK
jgi:hypothetical protein